MDASLLLRKPDALKFETQPFAMPTAPEPSPAPLNDPEAYQVQPGPVGAQLLAANPPPAAMPATPPPAAGPAAALAQPQAPPVASKWTPERKAFADKVNATARRYRATVEARRTQRQAISAYSKLHNQLEGAAGSLKDLQEMESTYKDIYTPDSPATLAIQKQQAQHFQKVQRLRDELIKRAAALNKQFGIPLEKNGTLQNVDQYLESSDNQFDSEAKDVLMDAYTTPPPQ
jgi:hypothetical protein